jgi:acyl-CoA synthetase (NDP forming)
VLLASREVDTLLVIHVAPYVTHAEEIAAAVSRAERAADGAVTVASCFLGLERPPTALGAAAPDDRRVPTFPYPEAAAQALAHAAQLGAWRARAVGSVAEFTVDRDSARARIARELAAAPTGTWASPAVASALLGDYGIPVVQEAPVSDASGAVDAARRVGFPVALKAVAPDLVHKSDVGGVVLGLRDASAVADAYDRMRAAVGGRMTGAVVQPMVAPGVELIAGIHHDPAFGPLVVFGAGGFTAELERDSVLLVPPLTDVDVDEALRSLRCSPLLFGYRGSPSTDVDSLRGLLQRIGQLACEVPEIADLDCNPVVVAPTGVLVVDAKVRLAPAPHCPDPFETD